jgi:hypothetical protein
MIRVVLLFGTGGHVQRAMTFPWLAVIRPSPRSG